MNWDLKFMQMTIENMPLMNFRVALRKSETGLDLLALTAYFKITVNQSRDTSFESPDIQLLESGMNLTPT